MKKTIKSALIILIIAIMLFVLVGCGEEEKETTENKNNVIEQTTEETKPEFSMGEWNNNVYTNEFLGLKFNLPTDWTYSSDEEIAEMMNIGVEMLNDDQKAAAEIAKLTGVYYMVAQDSNTGNNVNIFSEKQITEISTEKYITALKTQLSAVQSISYEIGETSKEKVANKECDTLTVSAKMSGVEVMQKYYIYKIDEYVIGIIATSLNGETGINEIMECFE